MQPAESFHLPCPKCGYLLRGVAGPRCPECGLELARLSAEHVQIPWEKARGWRSLWAYCSTALDAIFRPGRLHRAFYQPVSYTAARRFWWITLAVLVTCFAGAAFNWLFLKTQALTKPAAYQAQIFQAMGFSGADEYPSGPLQFWLENVGVQPILATLTWWTLGFVLFLMTGTGATSYLYQPRSLPSELQNRAIALSYYAPATLLVAPLGMLLPRFLAPLHTANEVRTLVIYYAGWLGVGFGLYLVHLVLLAQRCFRRIGLTARVLFFAPVLWLISLCLSALFGFSFAYVLWIFLDFVR